MVQHGKLHKLAQPKKEKRTENHERRKSVRSKGRAMVDTGKSSFALVSTVVLGVCGKIQWETSIDALDMQNPPNSCFLLYIGSLEALKEPSLRRCLGVD